MRCSAPILRGEYVGEYLGVLLDEAACTDPDVNDEFMFSVSTASIHAADVLELQALLHGDGSIGPATQERSVEELLATMPRVTVDAQPAGNITRCQAPLQQQQQECECMTSVD